MARPTHLPLYDQINRSTIFPRVLDISIIVLLICLLFYRLVSLKDHGFHWIIAFICEFWFTFSWILIVNVKWRQIDTKTYPENLHQRISELPSLDMFVTTADPALEPPILTVNTVLSLLAVDYPAEKLGCYVSDDAASPLTFYSLVEASKFAKLWVPFCKKHKIPIRAPFRYFSLNPVLPHGMSPMFQEDWNRVKDGYAQLCRNIEEASRRTEPCDLIGDFSVFKGIERRNHPTIIKVIWENKDVGEEGLPHLVYISREKHPEHPHHFKAGAMNVLARVSGMMTNAPFILNVDCDMYANNPQVVSHALCLLLGVQDEKDCAFVQLPQQFYDALKDDPYGNQMIVWFAVMLRGLNGIQGPFYAGTGCFHRRKVIYGASPDQESGNLKIEDLEKTYGKSTKLNKFIAQALSGSNSPRNGASLSPSDVVEEACKVGSCAFEYGTSWGKKVGLLYGSATEDILTGLEIHSRGWNSKYLHLSPQGFLGCAPSSGPDALAQHKRWSTGLLEILLGPKTPFLDTVKRRLQLRQCFGYCWILTWGLRSIFEICYATLPAYCIFTNCQFLPKVNETAIGVPISIFVIYNFYTLLEYLQTGQSIRAWWNNQRMARVITATGWLFGFLTAMLKLLGLSEIGFVITKKETSAEDGSDDEPGKFTFDASPIFLPCTIVLLINLTALANGLIGFNMENGNTRRWGMAEFSFSLWVVMCFLTFFKGLFRKGKHGIPLSTIYKAAALALAFVHFCRWITRAG